MKRTLRGVNLGGWLVLEKWMKPELFDGTDAVDETTFSRALTPALRERLQRHRDTFITEEDFAWIASTGLNTVRVPVPWWMFGQAAPYVGCMQEVQNAFVWAQRYGLGVLLDLHCAPGCQNGFDNGGIAGVMEWHRDPAYIHATLDVLDRLCEFVKPFSALRAIQPLNEPHWDIPLDIVQDFYRDSYAVIRRHFSPDQCMIVFHDSFRQDVWEGFLPEGKNVLFDAHFYQFQDEYKGYDYFQHAALTLESRRESLGLLARGHEVIVGEWSLGYPLDNITALSPYQRDIALRGFAANQLSVYEEQGGWIFWSYKTSDAMQPWSLRACVENGWLPHHFG